MECRSTRHYWRPRPRPLEHIATLPASPPPGGATAGNCRRARCASAAVQHSYSTARARVGARERAHAHCKLEMQRTAVSPTWHGFTRQPWPLSGPWMAAANRWNCGQQRPRCAPTLPAAHGVVSPQPKRWYHQRGQGRRHRNTLSWRHRPAREACCGQHTRFSNGWQGGIEIPAMEIDANTQGINVAHTGCDVAIQW